MSELPQFEAPKSEVACRGPYACSHNVMCVLHKSVNCSSTNLHDIPALPILQEEKELCISSKNASTAAARKTRKLILMAKRTGKQLGVTHCEVAGRELCISSNIASTTAARKRRKLILMAKRTGKQLGVTLCEATSQRECFQTARKKRMDIISSRRKNKESRTDNTGEFTSVWDFGDPSYSCLKCGAQMWFQERSCKNSGLRNPIFRLCCSDGRVTLPMLRHAPTFLEQLLTSKEDIRSKDFKKRIRTYNSLFAFTSMGGKVDYSVNKGGYGPYVFRLNGQNHHHIGSLLPAEGDSPRFAQLYFFDTENEVKNRIEAVIGDIKESTIDDAIVCGILEMLDKHNPLVKTFRMARDRFKEVGVDNVTIQLISERSTKNGLYNGPTCSEVAAVIVGDFGIESNGKDILIEYTKSGVQRIFEDHPSFMALQYPLLFPYGEDGFMHGIKYNNTEGVTGIKRKCVTIREYYAFRLQRRKIEGKTLFLAGRLFQQYIVDAYSCIEDTRLHWVRMNQGNLRSEIYKGLKDAVVEGDCDASKVGQRVILPATFTGGKRYMVQNYQDAMAICRWAGYPDLFLTFTCNPKWAEIVHGIEYSTSIASEDGPDLIARVFKIKLNSLMDDLISRKHFGKVKAAVYTIEFQKRGLPHAHILLFLDPVEKIQTVEHIDRFITAEIPDLVTDSVAYNIVRECMIHGPCGDGYSYNKCRVKGRCSKKFPKKFQNRTSINEDGFPMYRRRDTCVTITKGKVVVNNSYIVPYNRDLLVKYNAHINVEWCNRWLSIKYLFKYINKGSDRATVVLKKEREEININGTGKKFDETKAYLDCRYISAAEACWRIFNFDIHYRKPGVERLNFHLLDRHSVTFLENTRLDKVLTRPGVQDTMSTEWMKTNAANEEARQLTYVDFPTKWVWYSSDKTWRKRRNGICIGRIYHAHPSSGERFYLWMLLNVVKGPRSFEEIRTVGNVIYKTFKEACNAHGLFENDREWHECLVEASVWATSCQLRELFVTVLNNCQPAKPEQIWESNWKLLADDILYRQRLIMHCETLSLSETQLKAYVLCEIETMLQRLGKTLADFPKMPLVDKRLAIQHGNKLIQEELAYDKDMQMSEHEELFKGMNPEQFLAYQAMVDAVQNRSGGLFFIYGHGGTGKTYLYKPILSLIRARGEVALSVASSGIASLLLPGGRTAHSRFRIPLDIHEDSICDIKPKSNVAELILQTNIILWDEAPMAHKNFFEALDRALRDLMQVANSSPNTKPFGGKVVVLEGDFRQILPVVKKGTRADIVNAAINKSYLWKECQVFKLHQNMRLFQKDLDIQQQQAIETFAKWILDLGDGVLEEVNSIGAIKIPGEHLIEAGSDKLKSIVDSTYPKILENFTNPSYLRERAILAPTNDIVETVNEFIAGLLHGDEVVYRSSDSICTATTNATEQNGVDMPLEYLNSLKVPGLPNHVLRLKVGMPVMLLRNLNQKGGLCNGTRLIITRLGTKVIEAEIITGSEEVFPVDIRMEKNANDLGWACVFVLESLIPVMADPVFGKMRMFVTPSVKEKAKEIAEMWKAILEKREGIENVQTPDVHTLLQHLVTFGIVKEENVDLYRKIVVKSAWRKQMPKLAVCLGLCHKMPGNPFDIASKERKKESVKFLIENGTFLQEDINDSRFNMPLHYSPGLEWAYKEMMYFQSNVM